MAETVQETSMKVLERRDDLRHDPDYWFHYRDESDVVTLPRGRHDVHVDRFHPSGKST
jgi:hypothetical protein